MRAPSLNVPSLNVPDLRVANVTAPAGRLGKRAADKIMKRSAKKQKRRVLMMMLTRYPLLAAVGWLVGWLTDPVSGAERRQRLMGKAQSVLGRGEAALDQVRGPAATSFDRHSDPLADPLAPPVQPSPPQPPLGQ